MNRIERINIRRRAQLSLLLPWFSPSDRVLEVGAGTGVQSAMLADFGCDVTALEVVSDNETWTEYQSNSVYPLTFYDGKALPFEDDSFNKIFSASVLEHVADVQGLLMECRRVLAPGGRMVMAVPSGAWRFWSLLAYYPGRVVELWRLLLPKASEHGGGRLEHRKITFWTFFPSTHGEKGNVVTELVWFTRWRWRNEFSRAGLRVVEEQPLRIFVSGEDMTRLSVATRLRLGRVLGAPGRAFLIEST